MSKPSINDPDLARKFGYKNAFEFWANYSGQSTGTLVDHAQYTLTKCGYTGTLDDKFNAFMHDMFGTTTPRTSMDCYNSLKGYPLSNLTFFKNYANLPTGTVTASQLNANLAKGVATATFTATRSAAAPATYVDDNGVIQLVTTEHVGRIRGGDYDTTGFHAQKGLMIEGASTNLLVRTDGTASGSGLWTGWTSEAWGSGSAGTKTLSQVLATDITSISSSYSQRLQLTADAADATKDWTIRSTSTATGSFVQNDVATVSFWAKGTTSGCSAYIGLKERDASDAALATQISSAISMSSTEWRRYTHSFTMTNANCSKVRAGIVIGLIDAGDSCDVQIWGVQVEKSVLATSFIPTTTAALTRNAETLKYAIAGNRTAATESIFVKFSPMFTFANDGVGKGILSNDGSDRRIDKATTGTVARFFPNTDAAAATKSGTTTLLNGTSYCLGFTCVNSPSAYTVYLNGTQEGTTESTAWPLNTFGTYFYVGYSQATGTYANSAFQRLAFFSDAKGATDVAAITNLLNS